MSIVRYGAGYPPQDNENRRDILGQEIRPPQYPSLVCIECQERTLMQPVSPTAPYLVQPAAVFEDVTYPGLPTTRNTSDLYYCKPALTLPIGTLENGKQASPSGYKLTNTTAIYNTSSIAPAGPEEPTADETITISTETENRKNKSSRGYCSWMCWLIAAYLILLVLAVPLFYHIYQRNLWMQWREEQGRIDFHRSQDRPREFQML